jgi:hypothetical protein
MSLSKYEKYNLAAFVGSGLLLAVASLAFRTFFTLQFGIPAVIFTLQYSLGFAFLGVLLISLVRAKTYSTKIAYTVLSFTIGVGLLLPPRFVSVSDLALSVSYLLLAVGFGAIHSRFRNPSGALYVLAVTVLSHEFYLFGVAYCLLALLSTGQGLYVIPAVLLTAIIYPFRNVLAGELAKLQDERAFARGLKIFLDPLATTRN